MLRYAIPLLALTAAPAALAGPRLVIDAEPGSVTVVVDHRPDVIVVEREVRTRRTRRVVRQRGYDIRPVYQREVIVYDDYGYQTAGDPCGGGGYQQVGPPPHARAYGYHKAKRNKHHHKKWKKQKRKHKRHKRGRGNRGARFARY